MFNNMKNKIREKTGAELPKFTSPSTMFNKTRSNQHSRQSSQGSSNSIASDQGNKEESETKSLNNTEEEDTAKVVNLENKHIEKEKEWREKEKSYIADLMKQTKKLTEALALIEENKKLLCCREEKDGLEVYQKEEISKIKELLLAKEEENNANIKELKVALALIEKLKQDVDRLIPLEEKMNNYQDNLEYLRHTSEKERWNLNSLLVQKDEKIRHLKERNSVLTHRTEADCQALGAQLSTDERVRSLIAERALLERRLEEAHIHLSEIKTSWSNKIAILETQVGRLSRQAGEEGVERRNAEKKISELESRIVQYDTEKESLQKKLEKLTKERDNIALELKQLSVDNDTNVDEDEKLRELTTNIEVLSKENEALRLSNEESRRILDNSLCKEIANNNDLNVENVKLKEYTRELAYCLEQERKVKDETLLRNAEISQKVQLIDQELKEQQNQNEELFKKVIFLEEQLEHVKQKFERLQSAENTSKEEILKEKMKEMGNEINDKNKSIRILQQHLTDMKKTFQSEMKNNAEANKTSNNDSASCKDDINFKYMKHVLIKFLTSSEYEALQLTKAVSTLLKLSSEEERLIKETLEWRSSWFDSKPHVRFHNNHS